MRVWPLRQLFRTHPEERPSGRVSKDGREEAASTTSPSRGTKCPRDASFVALKKTEGAGNAGCRNAPAALRARMVGSTHASRHRYAEHAGIPCAMVHGLYVLSPVSGLFSHRRALRNVSQALDLSVGRPGPHDFARPLS